MNFKKILKKKVDKVTCNTQLTMSKLESQYIKLTTINDNNMKNRHLT